MTGVLHDLNSGLDLDSFEVTATFSINDIEAGINLADKFAATAEGVWELKLRQPIRQLDRNTIRVRVKDQQGNQTEIVRTFSVP